MTNDQGRQQLVVSLFPGVGLLDMTFEQEGFCVVRGPDPLWGGDIRRFHPPAGRFDGVIGGPPCQAFSRLRHIIKHRGYKPRWGNLIPEFERCCLEASPIWWLMENVPDAPLPAVAGYETWSTLLNNRQTGEAQNRLRRWTFGTARRTVLQIDTVAMENPKWEYCACSGYRAGSITNGKDARRATQVARLAQLGYRTADAFARLKRLQGLPDGWDLPGFLLSEKCRAVGEGVPLAMGRALARAVKEATKRITD